MASNPGLERAGALRCELHGPLNALSQSPDGERVVVAGRDVLKIVQIVNGAMAQGQNLRIMKKHLNFSSIDVHWHPLESYKNWLATAATNGAVVLWDLNMTDLKKTARIITEHTRTVNRVQFHATEPTLLLSGSQDGTMKMWDLRTRGPCIQTFDGRAESVRDVQFSPHMSSSFAAAFENGTVQIWDVRQPLTCEIRISGHQGPAFCLNWHPEDRGVLVSGGRDRIIKVWRTSSGRPENIATVHTIASVGRIKWRPMHRFHVASCSLVADNSVHVWDLQRPFIPFASFTDHRDLATDIDWAHGTDGQSIFSCSKDKFVMMNSMATAHFLTEDVPNAAVGWSVTGDMCVITANRVEAPAPHLPSFASSEPPACVYSHNRSFPTPSQYLSQSYFNRTKPPPPLASPAPVPFPIHPALAVLRTIPSQPMAAERRNVETQADSLHAFRYQAKHYARPSSSLPMVEKCVHNAQVAAACGETVASQTWRMLALLLANRSSHREDLDEGRSDEDGDSDGSAHGSAAATGSAAGRRATGDWKHGSRAVFRVPDTDGSRVHAYIWGMRNGARENTSSATEKRSPNRSRQGGMVFAAGESEGSGSASESESEDPDHVDSAPEASAEYGDFFAGREATPRDWVLSNDIVETLSPIPSPPAKAPAFCLSALANAMLQVDGDTFIESRPVGRTTGKSQERGLSRRPSRVGGATPFKSATLIRELLHFYAEQGSVQMCVVILSVLGEHATRIGVDSRTTEQWLHSYIELLQRMRLFSAATQVIKTAGFSSVRDLNTDSTTVYMACGTCNKPMLKQGPVCERCSTAASVCSLCHQTVRGAFAWCQGCGHGGHIRHMEEWFASHEHCPAGCNHRCTL